jgi:integrase
MFQGITEASAYQAMLRACRNAKVPHYHPHDLRHRRITIGHRSVSLLASSRSVRGTRGRP